jgi:hypothetical protein
MVIERRGLHIVLSTSATTVLGNGVVQVTITGTVLNPNGVPTSGITLSLGQNGFSTISTLSPVSNAQGQVFWTITDINVEIVTYAITNLVSNSVSIQFEASRVDGTVYGQRGPALAGANIYVVHQPANTSSIPPTVLLNIYADPLAQQTIGQPIITDNLGNYKFYAETTLFTLVVNNTQIYADQEAGKPSAAYHNLEQWVKSSQGPSVPGAQVFVLAQPANTPTILGKGKPSPQVQLYADPNGLVPISQPCITDSFGYSTAYCTAQAVTVAVYLGGMLQVAYPDQSVGGIYAGPMARYDGWVRNALGVAQPNARVLVSAQPCSIPGALVPEFPSNLAAIYSDPNGYAPVTQSLTYVNGNPVIQSLLADGDGHYSFYAAPNVAYTVSIYIQNKLQQFLPDQVL